MPCTCSLTELAPGLFKMPSSLITQPPDYSITPSLNLVAGGSPGRSLAPSGWEFQNMHIALDGRYSSTIGNFCQTFINIVDQVCLQKRVGMIK